MHLYRMERSKSVDRARLPASIGCPPPYTPPSTTRPIPTAAPHAILRSDAAGARCRPYLLTRGAAMRPKHLTLLLLVLLLLAACAGR